MPFTYHYPHMAVTVDAVVFRSGDSPGVLLIKRGKDPYAGKWALPGGFVDMAETAEVAAHRELHEETGLRGVELRFLHYFDAVDRDPRERTLSLVFWGTVDEGTDGVAAADDAADAQWHPLSALPPLAFDHADVLERALGAWRAP
ncbi:MAG: NUDIX hydrolase [Hyphomonadaceae bacterium]